MKLPSSARQKSARETIPSCPTVEIKTVTWPKDSHGLFDYENSAYEMKKFSVNNASKFFRVENSIEMFNKPFPQPTPSSPAPFENFEPLFSIVQDSASPSRFFVEVNDRKGQQEDPSTALPSQYLIVRSLKCSDGKVQRGCPLTAGQIIKLGRIEFRILEVCVSADTSFDAIDYRLYQHDSVFDVETQNEPPFAKERLCRYCYSEHIDDGSEVDDVMLYMCDCKGSAGGLHFACLKTWINYKTVTKSQYNNILTYQLKKLECDVCLKPFPRRMRYRGGVHEFLAIEKPKGPYLIIERVVPDASFASNISIIALEDKQEIRIGRGHVCDLRVSDISVSRLHALVKFDKDRFLIFDNDSKFGTLVKLDRHFPVQAEKAAIQVGRSVFTFVLKHKSDPKRLPPPADH